VDDHQPPEEMDEHQEFKMQVKVFLEGLPPDDSGLNYSAIMRKVKARHALPPSRVTKAPKQYGGNKKTQNTLIPHFDKNEDATKIPQKMIHLIRHGQSEGQVASRNDRKYNPLLKDCGLTNRGYKEAKDISTLLTEEQLGSIELVISSPLKRALHTALLGLPNHKIMVQYDLAEVGGSIPENSAEPMEDVLEDLRDGMEGRAESAELDYLSLQPKEWPHPQFNESNAKRMRKVFEWMCTREEQVFAVVCHYNVIRSAVYGAKSAICPENAVPIECRLLPNGTVVLI
jgi:broad specificity phosphatase PhoE